MSARDVQVDMVVLINSRSNCKLVRIDRIHISCRLKEVRRVAADIVEKYCPGGSESITWSSDPRSWDRYGLLHWTVSGEIDGVVRCASDTWEF